MTKMNSGTRTLIWENLFMADVRSRYFAAVAQRLRQRERMMAISVGVLSSGAAASLVASAPQWVSIVLSLMAAILAAAFSVLNLDKRVTLGASLSRQWSEVLHQYELLWARRKELTDATALRKHKELSEQTKAADELAIAEIGEDRKLLEKVFDETALVRSGKAA